MDTILCFVGAVFILSAVLLNYYGYRIVMGIGVVIELASYYYSKKHVR